MVKFRIIPGGQTSKTAFLVKQVMYYSIWMSNVLQLCNVNRHNSIYVSANNTEQVRVKTILSQSILYIYKVRMFIFHKYAEWSNRYRSYTVILNVIS